MWLHIGWEKTGSSAIQAFCARNRGWLSERGFNYPALGTEPQHAELLHELVSQDPRRVDQMMRRAREIVASSEEPAVIFSHESLHLCDPKVLKQMFKGHDVRVVAYLRRPDQAAISHFVTLIRYGNLPARNLAGTIRWYAGEHLENFDYSRQLEGFAEAFGSQRITLRRYDPQSLVGGQSVSDFMHLLGIEDLTGSSWPGARANSSLDIDQLAFVLRAARLLRHLPHGQSKDLTRRICDAVLRGTTHDPSRRVELFVSPALRRRIDRYYRPSLEMLYQQHFEGECIFEPVWHTKAVRQEPSPAMLDEFQRCLAESAELPGPILDRLLAIGTPLERELLGHRPEMQLSGSAAQ